MTDPVLPTGASTDALSAADAAALQRRRFLRGGALLAAAAGGAVAAGVTNAQPAAANDGDVVFVGGHNTGLLTTGLESYTASVPAVTTVNANGPSLRLLPIKESTTWNGVLPVGGLLAAGDGLYIGLEDSDTGTAFTSYLATGDDLAYVPATAPVTPRRLWDSKAKKGTVVARSSSTAVDSKGRLVKGAWVDIRVAATNADSTPIGAHLTVGSTKSSKDGFLTAYAPGSRPGTLSVAFVKGKVAAAGTYAGLRPVGSSFVVRVYASQTTHVTVDLTGLTTIDVPGPAYTGQKRATGLRSATALRSSRRER